MGFISDLANSADKAQRHSVRRAVETGRATWRQAFGTDKESAGQGGQRPTNGGSFGRSTLSSDASIKRLIQAMRSMAPGGWSDDRWEASARHFVGIAYAAIHRKCEQLYNAEFEVFERDDNHPDGKRPVKKNDPGWELVKLLDKPNVEDTFGDLMYSIGQQMDLTGMSLTWMVPNILGTPMELYPIPTAIAIPQPAVNPDFPDGYWRIQPVYPYGPFSSYPTPTTAVGAPIPAQWMIRIKFQHPILRYDGYSPLTAMRLHLDSIEQIDRSRWYSMKRAIDPSAVLNFTDMEGSQPLPEEEIARIHAEFENNWEGPENTGRLYVSTPGAELQPWGARPNEMEYQNGWDQLTNFVLGAGFGITKPAAGMVEDGGYATLYATLKQLNLVTLGPLCSRIGAKFTRFLAPFFGENLIVIIRCAKVDDTEQRRADLNFLMAAKALTKNEARKAVDYPVVSKDQGMDWGDEIAGYEKPPEQPGMPGMGGAPGGMPGLPGMGGGEEAPAPGAEAAAAPPEAPGGGAPPAEAPLEPPAPPPLGGGVNARPDELANEPAIIANSRPATGMMGGGALGPEVEHPDKEGIKAFNHDRVLIKAIRKRLQESKIDYLKDKYSLNGNGRR